jgi:hypothetical protein
MPVPAGQLRKLDTTGAGGPAPSSYFLPSARSKSMRSSTGRPSR